MAKENKWLWILFSFLFSFCSSNAELTYRRELLFFFDKLEVRGAIDVFIRKGQRNREAYVYADSEIIDNIQLKVSDRTLFLDANNTFFLQRRLPFLKLQAERTFPVEILLSVDQLTNIGVHENSNLTCTALFSPNLDLFVTSSGKVHLENLDCPSLTLRQEGSGTVVLKGKQVRQMQAQFSGNGNLWAQELELEDAIITHQGNGRIELHPSNWLDARIRGKGNLVLHHKPERMVVDNTGEGTVSDLLPDAAPYYDLNGSMPKLTKPVSQ